MQAQNVFLEKINVFRRKTPGNLYVMRGKLFSCGIDGLAEHKKAVIEKFGDEIGEHTYGKDKILIPVPPPHGLVFFFPT